MTTFAPLFIWIAVIFFLSSPQGSMAETSRFIGPLLRFLFPDAAPDCYLFVHQAIRKFAHFAGYFVLSFLAARAAMQGVGMRALVSVIVAILVGALVASLDEFNQSFEPSRTSAVSDVFLDIFGAICGAIGYAVIRRTFRRLAVSGQE